MYGQQNEPHATTAGSTEHDPKVEKYLPDIINKWQEKAKSTSLGNRLYHDKLPLTPRSLIPSQIPMPLDDKSLDDGLGLNVSPLELTVIKERKAFELELLTEKIKYKRQLKEEYDLKLNEKDEQLNKAVRVIGIQDGILKLLYDDPLGKEVLLGILNRNNIEIDKLAMLSEAVHKQYNPNSEKH